MEWFSVKDKLPDGQGISYGKKMSGPVLAKHKDRPDYPMVCHCVLDSGPTARHGIAIPIEFDSGYKSVEWYSALDFPHENPFGLQGRDYSNILPKRLGNRITHWAYIDI